MRQRLQLLVLLALPAFLFACATGGVSMDSAWGSSGTKLLTLEQASGRGERVDLGGDVPSYSWAPDGKHLILERGEDEEQETLWYDTVTWAESPAPVEEQVLEKEDDAWKVFAAAGADEERAKEIAEVEAQTGDHGGELRLSEGELWFSRDGKARRLAQAGADEIELEELAPDGTRVAFVQKNDLYVIDTGGGEPRSVTRDGGVNVFNGKLDWVYQEEIYGRGDFKAFWWSPDSKHIAFLRLDESAVHEFTVVDHVEEGNFRVKAEITKYPKVGDPNPTVRLGVTKASGGSVRWIDLSRYADEEPLVVRVDWTPEGDQLVYMVQDRIQTWLDLYFADPETGRYHKLFRETTLAWTPRPPPPHWLADGTFLWQSESSGQRHLHRYRRNGEHVNAVTSGPWSVLSVDEVDADAGVLWFTSTKDGAVNVNLYRIGLDGTGLKRLTQGTGRHSVTWNDERTMFIDRFSSLETPTRVHLCDAEGETLRELGKADLGAAGEYLLSSWEYHTLRTRDGFELDVALLKPVPFDRSASYPVWIPTYSGPNAPSVRNSWNPSSWYQFLAQRGVVVMQVNVRSASGKGLESTATAYLQLGVQELKDLEDAVDWITANPWADANRVGITGGSYGGFMSAYALTHSDKFALGIAASGVYDWHMYDSIYTERYMSTPDKNPDGYAKTSVLGAAADLNGHLIITHGVMDDNVHFQNAVQLVFELQKANQDFEFVLYPQSRHGIRHPELRWHDRRMRWQAIQKHLLGVEL